LHEDLEDGVKVQLDGGVGDGLGDGQRDAEGKKVRVHEQDEELYRKLFEHFGKLVLHLLS
jgi:hypothetical protein